MNCTDPATLATLAAYEEIREDQDPKSPSKPVVGGMIALVEPCEFDVGLASSDADGFVAGFRQRGGELPPGYTMTVEDSAPPTPGVVGRFKGPPVNAGRWTSSFAAVDNEGRESPAMEVLFVCAEKTEG